jgi:hypothetical protein
VFYDNTIDDYAFAALFQWQHPKLVLPKCIDHVDERRDHEEHREYLELFSGHDTVYLALSIPAQTAT